MNKEMRILVVEDNPADADLIRQTLAETGPVSFHSESVARLSEALTRLQEKGIDLVLLDLGLPDSRGLATLHQLRQAAPDVPVIVLSGTDDHELAVAAVRDGAQDYLVKGQFGGSLLVHAARCALERQKTVEALHANQRQLAEANQMLQLVMDTIPVRIFWKDRDSVYQGCNRLFAKDAGRKSPSDLLGDTDYNMGWRDQAELYRTDDREVMRSGKPKQNYEEPETTPDGKRIWVRTSKIPLRDLDNRIVGILGTYEDITEHKRAEEALRLAHERLRRFVDSNMVGIVIANAAGNILEANDYYLRLTGFTREELEHGKVDWRAITPPEWLPADEQAIRELRERGTCTPYEKEYLRRDGTRVSVLLADAMLPGPEEQIAAFVLDLTERKRTEKALQALSARQEAILAAVPDIIMEVDRHKVYTWANQAGLAFFGADVVGKEAAFYFEGEQPTYALVQPLFEGLKDIVYVESWQRRQDGEKRLLAWWCRVLKDGSGNVTGTLSTGRDITESKLAEEALRQEQTLFNSLASTIPDNIYFKDRQSRFVRVNQTMAQRFGLRSPGEATGKTDFDFFSDEHARQAYEDEQRVMRTGEPLIGLEEKETWPDGHATWVSTTKVPLRDENGAITGLVGISRDITERKRAEERIREQAALLDNANDAIYVTTLDGTILYWNRGAERTYGWTSAEALNRKTTDLISPDPAAVEALAAVLLKQESWSGERSQMTKNGQKVEVFSRMMLVRNEQGQPQAFFAINTDITEKKQLEARFLRAQRLESVGALASGIAHDLNNVLAPIIMGAPLLQNMVKDQAALYLLKTMETSARRGAAIVKQVLTFARGIEGERVPLQPRHLLREMERLAAETFPKGIRVESDVAADLWPVLGDATQLHQALMNLCINARDAMPGGGVLTLEAANIVFAKEAAEKIPGAEPGSYACLRVTDTGTGIPPEIEAKMFEPFFTTKGVGKGTGLGLSTVLGIVRSHGGFVRVASKVGQGSTFELYLPATTTEQVAAKSESAAPWPSAHGEGILVVDDEAAVREVARQALMKFGYQVITTGSGAEALTIFQERRQEIQLVLTDMMMPEMDGPTLVAALRLLDPKVRIVGITGMSDMAGMNGMKTLALSAMLAKPFTIEKLLAVIREALPVTAGHERAVRDGGESRLAPPG